MAGLQRSSGFTLVELVTVILLLGILAAVAAPRFFDRGGFDERAFYDEAVSAVRYAQKLAVASGCGVQVTIAGGSYVLHQPTGCATGVYTRPVPHPSAGGDFGGTAPSGISFSASPSTFIFNALGSASAEVTVSVNGRSFQVIAASGYVDAP